MGLPCSHELNRLIGNIFSLGGHHFHRHWWLEKPQETECNDCDTSADAMTDFADALTQLQYLHKTIPHTTNVFWRNKLYSSPNSRSNQCKILWWCGLEADLWVRWRVVAQAVILLLLS